MPRGSAPFIATPSLDRAAEVTITTASKAPKDATALGVPVASRGAVPRQIGLDRDRLAAAGFRAEVGSALVLPSAEGPTIVAVGVGDPSDLDATRLRDAAAAFARAAAEHARLATSLADLAHASPDVAGQAVVEGVLLARYRYGSLQAKPKGTPVAALTLVAGSKRAEQVGAGAERGHAFARAQMLARDLANTPHSHLTASLLGDIAVSLGKEHGFEVEVFDEDALVEMGCGGLLSINAGSAEPPRMIKLTYRPKKPTGRLAMVGKGIMYDSGGISLKPSDRVHAQMKNDMSGAGAVLAAVAAVAELGSTTMVTGYLMCTDNMPSGTATGLGDVVTIRGGTTMEMIDTDAEGRVIMSDALVLAAEERNDAIVDIATLTGSALRALGTDLAAIFANNEGIVEQVKAAATATDELVWQLPLHRPYRKELDSLVADIVNCAPIGKPDAILAALFLAEFVGDVPWAHIDMCGQAQTDADQSWHVAGCSGFGARLLLQLALDFQAPAS